MKVEYVVSVDLPDGVSVTEMQQYIDEAVSVWCGHDHTSPIFNLNKNSVTVELFVTTLRREFKKIESDKWKME